MTTSEFATTRSEGRRAAAAERRRQRERDILAATRQLFDERGVRDAPIEEIAKAVGINRAIIYRHFSGKEDLFALTLVGYLDELRELLVAADDGELPAPQRLTRLVETFFDYGIAYPAFVDCAHALMRIPGGELFAEVDEATMFRLGRAMSACLSRIAEILEEGQATGDFEAQDVHLTTHMIYAAALGAVKLGRVGLIVREAGPGIPSVTRISIDRVREGLVTSIAAVARGHRA